MKSLVADIVSRETTQLWVYGTWKKTDKCKYISMIIIMNKAQTNLLINKNMVLLRLNLYD